MVHIFTFGPMRMEIGGKHWHQSASQGVLIFPHNLWYRLSSPAEKTVRPNLFQFIEVPAQVMPGQHSREAQILGWGQIIKYSITLTPLTLHSGECKLPPNKYVRKRLALQDSSPDIIKVSNLKQTQGGGSMTFPVRWVSFELLHL